MKETNINVKRTWDIERLTALHMEALKHTGIPLDSTKKFMPMTTDYYRRHLTDGTLISCIASDNDGSILGYGDLCMQDSLPEAANDHGKSAFITNIYVRPGHNAPAVADSIYEWLRAEGVSHGADKVRRYS